MAAAVFLSWCIYVGLSWANAHDCGVSLAVSDAVLSVGMAVCAISETEQGTRRWIGMIQLLAAVSMVVGGVAAALEAVGIGPVAFDIVVLNHLTSAAALAFLVLATVRRMKLDACAAEAPGLGLGQLSPATSAIN